MPPIALLFLLALAVALPATSCAHQAPATSPVAVPAQADAADEVDYLPAHPVKFELDGVLVGGFKEVEIVEYQDGDDPVTRKRPGRTKVGRVTLTRGFVADPGLLAWIKQAETGEAEPRTASMVQALDGNPTLAYELFECYPVRAEVKDVGHDVYLVEKIELAVEKIERANPKALRARHDTAKNAIGNIR